MEKLLVWRDVKRVEFIGFRRFSMVIVFWWVKVIWYLGGRVVFIKGMYGVLRCWVEMFMGYIGGGKE